MDMNLAQLAWQGSSFIAMLAGLVGIAMLIAFVLEFVARR